MTHRFAQEGEFIKYENASGCKPDETNELKYFYRLRLHVAADLGEGYFAKALISSETPGWLATVGDSNSEQFALGVCQIYFGRMMEHSHYMMGRLPLGSLNNPIFDPTVYPLMPVELPVFLVHNDRLFGVNYGAKVGPGELNATLVVLDNDSSNNDWENLLDDSYGLHVSYKANIGDITVEPQFLAALTDSDVVKSTAFSCWNGHIYDNVTPFTFGANVTIPAGDTKFTLSGFYTTTDDESDVDGHVKYDGYFVRAKASHGPVVAWAEYSATDNESDTRKYDSHSNMFLWGQYNWKVHESSMGSFTISPTVRYLAAEADDAEFSRLRTELWATVKF